MNILNEQLRRVDLMRARGKGNGELSAIRKKIISKLNQFTVVEKEEEIPDISPEMHEIGHAWGALEKDGTLDELKEIMPDKYEDVINLHNKLNQLSLSFQKVIQKKQFQKMSREVEEFFSKSEKKNFLTRIDLRLDQDKFDEAVAYFGYTPEAFEEQLKTDPEELYSFLDSRADTMEEYAINGIADLVSPNSSERIANKNTIEKLKKSSDDIVNIINIDFANVRELPGKRAPEVDKLLADEDRLIGGFTGAFNVGSINKHRSFLKDWILRGFVKMPEELEKTKQDLIEANEREEARNLELKQANAAEELKGKSLREINERLEAENKNILAINERQSKLIPQNIQKVKEITNNDERIEEVTTATKVENTVDESLSLEDESKPIPKPDPPPRTGWIFFNDHFYKITPNVRGVHMATSRTGKSSGGISGIRFNNILKKLKVKDAQQNNPQPNAEVNADAQQPV